MGFRDYLGVFCVVAAVSGPVALTSSAQAQSLEEALIEAYLNNPTLQAQRAQLRVTDEGVPQASAGWRPNVELIGDITGTRSRLRTRTSRTDSTRLSQGIDLRVTQNLYDGGGTDAAVEGAQADVLAARANLISAEQSILLQVVTSYMDVLRDEAVVELNRQNVERLRRQLEATQDRYDAGVATLTDVAQAESRIARSRSDLLTSEGDLEVSKALFEEVVGMPPTNLLTPSLAPDLPAGRAEAREISVEQNPSVLAAIYSRRAALHSIDEQFADLLPSVDVIGTLSRSWDESSNGSRSRSYSLAAQVTVPIYQQGFETSEVRAAKMAAAQALMEIEEARRDVVEQTLSAWESYTSVVATITAIQEEIRAAEIALEGVQQEERVGQRTVLDVLDAEQELLDANVSLVRARRDETVARFELIAALGSLTARDLDLDVQFYDPGVHYNAVEALWWGIGDDVPTDATDAAARGVEP